jgi:putative FmdB family regulatory protein
MPIYAYRCEDCGHAQDFLQKMSDPLIDTCPNCGSKNFRKQVTAAGFQLKGGGWYVTDFRDNGKKSETATGAAAPSKTGGEGAKSEGGKSEAAGGSSSTDSSSSSSPAASSPASSSTPAASSSGGSASGTGS